MIYIVNEYDTLNLLLGSLNICLCILNVMIIYLFQMRCQSIAIVFLIVALAVASRSIIYTEYNIVMNILLIVTMISFPIMLLIITPTLIPFMLLILIGIPSLMYTLFPCLKGISNRTPKHKSS